MVFVTKQTETFTYPEVPRGPVETIIPETFHSSSVGIGTEFLPDNKRYYFVAAETGKVVYEHDELNENVVPGSD
jgi:hypothetical protein